MLKRLVRHQRHIAPLVQSQITARFSSTRTVDFQLPRNLDHQFGKNFIFCIVPQQEEWIVERFGKFDRVLSSGFHIKQITPIEKIAYIRSMKEVMLPVDPQQVQTCDGVHLTIDGFVSVQVFDTKASCYTIDRPFSSISNVAQGALRATIGSMTTDEVFQSRNSINRSVLEKITKEVTKFGIECFRYEIASIDVAEEIKRNMEKQMIAERDRREQVIHAEAKKKADIYISEGQKISTINNAEAKKQEVILEAEGYAESAQRRAEADAYSVKIRAEAEASRIATVANVLQGEEGAQAAGLNIALEQVNSWKEIAKTANHTVILPGGVDSTDSLISKALTTYKAVANTSKQT